MAETNLETRRIALLFDGDNAQAALVEKIIAEVSKYGIISVRRIYGDWTTPQMHSWKDLLNTHSIQPMQQFRYTVGKNATDSALIIDAMDILHDGYVNGFAIVSSDSDYTRLATRIREKGFFVLGIGKLTTPKAFVNACEIFVYTENLAEETRKKPIPRTTDESSTAAEPTDVVPLLKSAIDSVQQDDGWASLGPIGQRLHQLDPGFDPRTYGYRQLSQLIKAHKDVFEINEKKSASGPTQIYIRINEPEPEIKPKPRRRRRTKKKEE